MPPHDFLHRNDHTPLCKNYHAPGFVWSLSTNDEQLFEATPACFSVAETAPAAADFSARFWIDHADQAKPPWPNPYVRGLDQLIFAGFDARSSMIIDLQTRRVTGRFSIGMARDHPYWRTVIFPVMLSLLAGSLSIVELHCACLARAGKGMMLIGQSQSGKSTLAMALMQMGFDFLADDRTFCSLNQEKLVAWALPRPLKVRREAAAWFDEFRHRKPTRLQDGEHAFLWEPDRGSQRPVPECEPATLIVLERQLAPGFDITPINPKEIKTQIERDLLAECPDAEQRQCKVIDQLVSLPCWVLRYGGTPQTIAMQLAKRFCS